ncbi:MAG TPA: bifunctional metallophosphatase/5'-nucleotidase [Actinomycetes bacterium]|nr:bifunctional metallophosphatase/5'-nucleotidase [Actinomycetes bacterium]
MSASGLLRRRTPVAVAAVAAVGLAAVASASAAYAGPVDLQNHQKNRVSVQMLSFNDYHGHLEPDTGRDGSITFEGKDVVTNGASYLATHLRQLRKGHPHSVTVAAGDLIGGSTFTSGVFHDEPAIETLDRMGLDVSGVGNHEFDEGVAELRRIKNGGCHPVDGCFQKDAAGNDIRYPGADFTYLAANVVNTSTGKAALPRYWVKKFGTVKVGFIGMTLEGTDTLVSPSGIAGYDFTDEVKAGNAAARVLQKKKGVKAIVVLLHEGGLQTGSYSGCAEMSGPIVDIAQRMTSRVDAIVTGHTHQAYNCTIDDPKGQPRKVTSAASFGRVITETNFKVDTRTGDVVRKSVRSVNHLVTRDVPQDPSVRAIVDKWVAMAAGPGNRVVGSIKEDIKRSSSRGTESSLPNLIADAQKASTGSVVAFMNPGGVRADFLVSNSPAGEAPGQITYREAYNVQPFSNILQTFDMTGAQIDQLLEQQWMTGRSAGNVLRLGISDGFTYSWSASAPEGSKVNPASIKINGVVVDPSASYRVTANSFIADGGDSFTAFVNGAPRTGGKVDLDALIDYFKANPNLAAPPAARSTQLP